MGGRCAVAASELDEGCRRDSPPTGDRDLDAEADYLFSVIVFGILFGMLSFLYALYLPDHPKVRQF